MRVRVRVRAGARVGRREEGLFARFLELLPAVHLDEGSHTALRDADAEG